MTYTLTEARAALRNHLDEQSVGNWSTAQLDQYINATVTDIARRTMCHEATSTVSLTSGTSQFLMPTNALSIDQIMVATPNFSTDLDPVKLEYVDHRTASRHYTSMGTGRARLFSVWGATPTLMATIYPTVDANCEAKVWYYRHATKTTVAGNTLDLPNGWDDLVMLGAEYMALRQDRDARWKDAKVLYEESLADAMESFATLVQASGMVATMHGTFPNWLTERPY